jgi:exonuclease III
MRIVTWNANKAFRNKQRILVERLNPDVAFIQECEHPEKFEENLFPFTIWKGKDKNKGIAVFSKYEIIELNEISPLSRFYIPFKIKGTFFIGIWAMDDKEIPQNRYIAQVWNILNKYKELLKNDIVILGDFNWNIIWDKKPDYPLAGDFRDINAMLNKYDIESAYHHHFKEDFGNEKNHTFFMHKKEEKPYHTDYIFLKKNTIENLKEFSVGKHDEWIKYSDHVPLLIEI